MSPTYSFFKIEWKRLLWISFTVLYLSNFTKNFLIDTTNGRFLIPLIFYIMIFLWLGIEYYFRSLFFQSGIFTDFNPILRTAFAVFFYSFLAISTWDFINSDKLFLPISLLGLFVIGIGIYIRTKALLVQVRCKKIENLFREKIYKIARHPRYIGMLFIIIATPLVFMSWRGAVILLIGVLLTVTQMKYEEKVLSKRYGKIYIQHIKNTPLFFRI